MPRGRSQGPPIDDEEDSSFPTWAEVIPLEMVPADQRSETGCRAESAGVREKPHAETLITERGIYREPKEALGQAVGSVSVSWVSGKYATTPDAEKQIFCQAVVKM